MSYSAPVFITLLSQIPEYLRYDGKIRNRQYSLSKTTAIIKEVLSVLLKLKSALM